MTVLSACGAVILACVLCLTLKQVTPHYGKIVAVSAGVLILGVAISKMRTHWQTLTSFLEIGKYGTLFLVLGKAMGIALMVETTADICRDAGEESLASRILFFGKVEILLLSLPLMQSLLKLMQEVMA